MKGTSILEFWKGGVEIELRDATMEGDGSWEQRYNTTQTQHRSDLDLTI